MTWFLAIFLQLVLMSFAHVQMISPPPLRSKYDPQSSSIDYSMTDPLTLDGSDFPCKGYQNDPITHTVATYAAGSSYTIQLAGTAVHGGGSCQISLSYNNGESFQVIHSMIGGCPLPLSYEFTVPSDAPQSGQALLAWTWFNEIGNREMYMNCARVKVTGSGSGFTAPAIFEANIFGSGTCNTPDNKDIIFPNPGDSVEYGGSPSSRSSGANLPGCPSSNDNNISSGSGSSSASSPSRSSSSSFTSSTALPRSPLRSSSVSNSSRYSTEFIPPTPSTFNASAGYLASSCVRNSIKCISDVLWALCTNDVYVDMGRVAPGTTCSNGKLTKRTYGNQ
ncbi:hypothetical protein NEOLI_001382 [Neolecta irregularis DAH-3]|uniref:Extracellular protein n=1 Tax=Neolecta irregularis (strain DAH-3) TaxID=1198029 RepID=A0A1U7LT66_NEOID|nr:hypothetical protein NEOLI_001382 [Neolecta irregularis DAH-3]|eukprot:OLL25865.1 hypothetical protein NEOLI_001382 [Neolecta irregularis DAH-3]